MAFLGHRLHIRHAQEQGSTITGSLGCDPFRSTDRVDWHGTTGQMGRWLHWPTTPVRPLTP